MNVDNCRRLYRDSVKRILVILFLLTISMQGFSLTYYSRVASFSFAAAGNNWSLSSSGGTLVAYPGTGHDYIIQSGNNVTIAADQTAVSIVVNGTLTIGGNFTVTSPITVNSGGNLTIGTSRFT